MYLGNQPALSYTSFAKQDFTTSATTSYTLDNPVANANELALFINFVRQEPTTAYSASGTSLTLTSATSASDDMYCVYLGKAVQTVNPPNASVGLSQLTATGTKDATTFLRGDNTFASAGGDNTPAFKAYVSTGLTFANNTLTKVSYQTEMYDTDNCFDNSSTYRFTPTSAGKYFLSAKIRFEGANFTSVDLRICKNDNTNYALPNTIFGTIHGTYYDTYNLNGVLEANGTTDHFSVYAQQNTGSNASVSASFGTSFEGFKLLT